MKMKIGLLAAAAGVLVLVIAGVTIAQRGALPGRAEDNLVRLRPGQEMLIHASPDTVIEVFVDQPESYEDMVIYHDLATGKKYSLPNGAWVRLQGHVVVGRDKEATPAAATRVRYRSVDSIFRSFSRDVRSR